MVAAAGADALSPRSCHRRQVTAAGQVWTELSPCQGWRPSRISRVAVRRADACLSGVRPVRFCACGVRYRGDSDKQASGPDPAPADVPEGDAMSGMDLSADICEGCVVVALRGDLDVTGAADAEAALTALMIPGRCLVIDMLALDFIDCGALGALLRVQELAWSMGGDVVLAAPQPYVRRLLALTGKDKVFWILASVAAAVAGPPGRGTRYAGRRLAASTARPGRAAPSRTGTG